MIKLPYEEIAAKIKEDAGISDQELDEKVTQKLQDLSGLVSKEGAAQIVANELGVKLEEAAVEGAKVTVDKIFPGMRSISFKAKVQRVFDLREFNTGTRSGKVQSFVAGDETGTIRIVLWNDQVDKIATLKENDVVEIENAYVKENNNQKEIHLNDQSKIEINPAGVEVGEVKETKRERSRKKIDQLQENETDVEILGTVVQAFEPRFFETCSSCGKRARPVPGSDSEFICEVHGKTAPKYSYVLNAVIDDGTGTIRVVFFKNQAENLTKKSEEELTAMRQDPQQIELIKTDLLGEIVKIVGRVTKNTMFDRLEFVSQLVFRNPDPDEELQRL